MTPDEEMVRRFISKFDERLALVYGYISHDCPEDAKEWHEDVELLMKLALRRQLSDEDRSRLVQRGRPPRAPTP